MDWRKGLIYTHRWLGIAGGGLFLIWFASGIVMLYARMPSLSPEERLLRLPELVLSKVHFSPAQAAKRLSFEPQRLRVAILEDRPVYRFALGPEWTTVFADTAQVLDHLTPDQAMSLARRFLPKHSATTRYDAHLQKPDQWTLQLRTLLPMHRIALGDSEDTVLYVSDPGGEVVLKTTATARRWAYLGPVLHWLYFTPFRVHTNLWLQSLIWLSIAGCVLSLSGLIWGIWCYSPNRRYQRGGSPSQSPFTGWLRWHHYAGLIFGLVTFTWILSGGLSLDPWNWHPSTSPSIEQRERVAGGPFRLDGVTVAGMQEGLVAIAASFTPKELELMQFQGEPYWLAYRAPAANQTEKWTRHEPSAFLSTQAPLEHRLVSARAPKPGAFAQFDRAALEKAAEEAMPEHTLTQADWLQEYDAYYYNRYGARTLPVLRVRYDDPTETWLYLDPKRGLIVHKEERLTRLNRWLYHGLHNLDFPFLYYRRPLWDIVVIGLSLGGIVLSTTTLLPAWRRLCWHARRLSGRGRGLGP